MSKKPRLERIKTLIHQNSISTQDELLELLRREGYDVTQATVSRDIKELRVIKITDDYGVQKYVMPGDDSNTPEYSEIFSKSVISVTSAVNDIVIKCYNGMANAACAALDSMDLPEVVGTLAGDDTIFVITNDEQAALTLVDKLKQIIRR